MGFRALEIIDAVFSGLCQKSVRAGWNRTVGKLDASAEIFLPFPAVECKRNRASQLRIPAQNGIREVEADVIGLKLRRAFKHNPAPCQRRRKLKFFIHDRRKIFAVQRIIIKISLKEHQPSCERLLDKAADDFIRKRQRAVPLRPVRGSREKFTAIFRIAPHPDLIVFLPAGQDERPRADRVIGKAVPPMLRRAARNDGKIGHGERIDETRIG